MNADHVSLSKPRARPAGDDEDPEALKERWHVMVSAHFGIRPWEWDLLSWGEVTDYVSACKAIIAAQPK